MRSNRVAATALTGRRRPNGQWLGCRCCRRRRLHPLPRGERGVWAKPHGVSKTLEGRAVGDNVPKAHHKQPLGIYAKDAPSAPSKGFRGSTKIHPKAETCKKDKFKVQNTDTEEKKKKAK